MTLPQGGAIRDAKVVDREQPGRTWRIDWEAGRVVGMVDGLEAVKQAVYKVLQTPRYEHLIYTPNYGHELRTLIGKDPLLIRSEARRMIREALMQDDRILAVEDFDVKVNGDSILIAFTVRSRYGSFRAQQEVR